MQGNEIVLRSPYGQKDEGIIQGNLYPGMLVQIVPGVAPVNKRLTWEAFTPGANGYRGLFAILDMDYYQGFGPLTPYVSGARCFLWYPNMGDEFNVMVGTTGTATASCNIGDLFEASNGTGFLIPSVGTPGSQPFQAIEAVTGILAAGSLVMAKYSGY